MLDLNAELPSVDDTAGRDFFKIQEKKVIFCTR